VLSQVPQAVRRLGRWQRCVTDGGVDAVVSVGDDQLDAAQAAAGEWKGAIPPLAAGQHDVAREIRNRAARSRLEWYARTTFVPKQQWRRLAVDARSGVEVAGLKHEPNVSSGAQISYTDIGKFLRDGANGPEHQALLKLIGTLMDN
jgi:hypothetical protein